jgi:hypothetical protein
MSLYLRLLLKGERYLQKSDDADLCPLAYASGIGKGNKGCNVIYPLWYQLYKALSRNGRVLYY